MLRDVDRRTIILEAAAEAFFEKGFHGVSVDELGQRAGLSGPALYRTFSGKNEILANLLNSALDELTAAITSTTLEVEQDLDLALRHHIHFSRTHRPLVRLYQQEARSLMDPWKSTFDTRRREYLNKWISLIGSCFPLETRIKTEQQVQSALGTIFSLTMWPQRVLTNPSLEQELFDFVKNGLECSARIDLHENSKRT